MFFKKKNKGIIEISKKYIPLYLLITIGGWMLLWNMLFWWVNNNYYYHMNNIKTSMLEELNNNLGIDINKINDVLTILNNKSLNNENIKERWNN